MFDARGVTGDSWKQGRPAARSVMERPHLTISDRQPHGSRRALRFALCTIALATALVLSGNPVVYASGSDYRGTVVARHSDDFAGNRSHFTYLLQRPGREDLRLTGATSKLTLGATTELSGERSGNTVELQSVGAATNADPQQAPSGSPQKVAVLLVNFSNDTSQPWTPSQIKQAVFTGPDSVNSYFQEESSGSIYLAGNEDAAGDVFGWYTIPNSNANCTYSSFATAARNQAALDGKDLSSYDNVVYVWPDVAACNWSGLAYLPGDEAFINGAPSLRVISHELSHNLGIHHASSLRCTSDGQRVFISSSCSASEYGDPFSVMGSSASNHSHGWHKMQLGFLPSTNMQTVTTSGSYHLSPSEQYLPGETQLLRVPHGKTSNGQPDYYYMDLRQPFGSYFDDFLSNDPAVNGVTVRIAPGIFLVTQSKLLDGNPQTTSFGDAPLGVGQSATDAATGVTIAPTAVGPGGATVNITIAPPQSAQPTSPTPGGSTNSPVAAAPPTISFTTHSRHVLRTHKLVVSAGCQLGCSLSANATVGLGKRRAKLVPARAGAPAGTPVLLELRFTRSSLKLVKRAKRAGKRVSVSLKLSALGSDGQTSSTSSLLAVKP